MHPLEDPQGPLKTKYNPLKSLLGPPDFGLQDLWLSERGFSQVKFKTAKNGPVTDQVSERAVDMMIDNHTKLTHVFSTMKTAQLDVAPELVPTGHDGPHHILLEAATMHVADDYLDMAFCFDKGSVPTSKAAPLSPHSGRFTRARHGKFKWMAADQELGR